jgi:translation initiation factor 2 subunit 3
MQNQPILNIGCLGSVSDGKSTTVEKLTGTKTQRHSSEKIRNITIKPGYANMKIWYNKEEDIYETTNSQVMNMENFELVHHLSFVDCPGHQELILTMMSSVSLMKGALVVVAANEDVKKKPQLIQHLAAAKMAGLDKLIILFNKLDLVSKEVAMERKEQLDELLQKLEITPKYIIPTSVNKKIGIQNVIKAIMEVFPPKVEEEDDKIEFKITRSFDINKPGINWDSVEGGVIGGSLISGKLKVGDTIEIRPGRYSSNKDGFNVIPIKTKILSIESEKIKLDDIISGGLTAIGTDIDPVYCKDGKLEGSIMGLTGNLPDVYSEITMKINLTDAFEGEWEPKKKDTIFLQIGNVNTESQVVDIKEDKITFKLSKPSCIPKDSLILICSDNNEILRIVGYGNMNSKESKKIIL